MSQENGLNFNAQISEEAAQWVVEFRTGEIDETGRRQFDAWMRSSPEHLRAFLEIAAIWNEGSGLDASHELDVETLALRARAADNVVPIDMPATQACRDERTPSSLVPARPLAPGRPGSFYRRIAVAVSIAVTAVGLLWWESLRATTYTTAVGEQQTFTLPDGSTVELDSRSAIRLRFRTNERDIDLMEGQALFHVAKDRTRPFVVASNGTRVRAVGTQFDVYQKPEGTVVTVVEGRVAVTTTAFESKGAAGGYSDPRVGAPSDSQTSLAIPGGALLSAGEQVTLIAQVVPKPIQTNVAAATAWTQHQLVLDSARLIDVAAEFNRYSTRKLVVDDSSDRPLLLSGVFSTDPDFLIRYLRARSDVSVKESSSEVRIVRKE